MHIKRMYLLYIYYKRMILIETSKLCQCVDTVEFDKTLTFYKNNTCPLGWRKPFCRVTFL